MPKSFNKASPAKKKARNNPNAVRQACPALMVLCCSFMLTKMGIEPKMSIMAAITMKELNISTKLMFLNIVVYAFQALTVIAGLTRNRLNEKESSPCSGDGGCSSAMTVKV